MVGTFETQRKGEAERANENGLSLLLCISAPLHLCASKKAALHETCPDRRGLELFRLFIFCHLIFCQIADRTKN